MLRDSRRVAALSALAGALLCARPAAANPDDHRYQSWLGLFTHAPVDRGRWRNLWIWGDVHLRGYESFEPANFIVRPGLSWRARPNFFVTAGYAWTPAWLRDERPRTHGDLTLVDEHRTWQQLLWTPNDRETGLSAQFRARLEQRFRPGQGEVGSRLRVFWRGQSPISRDRDRTFIVVLWNELFIGLNETDWGQVHGVDQNRAFFGFGWQALPRAIRLELGYMNRWAPRPGPDPVDHVLMLNLFFGW